MISVQKYLMKKLKRKAEKKLNANYGNIVDSAKKELTNESTKIVSNKRPNFWEFKKEKRFCNWWNQIN